MWPCARNGGREKFRAARPPLDKLFYFQSSERFFPPVILSAREESVSVPAVILSAREESLEVWPCARSGGCEIFARSRRTFPLN